MSTVIIWLLDAFFLLFSPFKASWIQIRIRIRNTDPDPDGHRMRIRIRNTAGAANDGYLFQGLGQTPFLFIHLFSSIKSAPKNPVVRTHLRQTKQFYLLNMLINL
jgi:hypothetical protein